MNPKALQTYFDLEAARCNERWTEIPELAKRYKKYHPYESVLEFTARMEAEFILLSRQLRQSKEIDVSSIALTSYSSIPNMSGISSHSSLSRTFSIKRQPSSPGTPPLNNQSNLSSSTAKRFYGEEPDTIYQLDDPNNISLPASLPPFKVQLILVRLIDVIQRQIKTDDLETPDDWQAQLSKIIVARIYYESGRYAKAREWLQKLALKMEDVMSGYGLVLLVQARVIKGICFEQENNVSDAMDSYLSALSAAEQYPDEMTKALSSWLEDCLYRSILLQLKRKGPVKQTLKLMRTYLSFCQNIWPADWRIHKRWVIFRHYIRYVTRAYQKGVYVPATPEDRFISIASPIVSPTQSLFSDNGDTRLFEQSAAALNETIQLVTQFRTLLSVFATQLLEDNQLELKHRTLELTTLLVSAHDTMGWGTREYMERTLTYFHRIRQLTFNSLSVTRHIFHILLRLGNVEEARHALLQYLALLGIPELDSVMAITDDNDDDILNRVVETIQGKLQSIVEDSTESANYTFLQIESRLKEERVLVEETEDANYVPFKPVVKRKPPPGSFEYDNDFDVVRLLLIGAQEIYATLLENAQYAVLLTDIGVSLMEESELKKKKASQWRSLMVQCRRTRGISYTLWASRCNDEERRFAYYTESLLSLKRASELDPRSWQTYYELGIQQAMMGDLTSAATSIRRCIKLRGDFIPSWHLLGLIQSSRQVHSYPKALQLLQSAFAYGDIIEFINQELEEEEGIEIVGLNTEEGIDFFDNAESYMKLRMTQVKLIEALEGSESVLKIYPDLFDMYYKFSRKMNININVAEKSTVATKRLSISGSSIRIRQRSFSNRTAGTTTTDFSFHSNSSQIDDLDSLDSMSLSANNELQSSMEDADFKSFLLRVTEEELDIDFPMEDRVKPEKKRRSMTLVKQLMDDPLISIPTKKKEKKKEKREKKDKKDKKDSGGKSKVNSFLGIRTSIRGSTLLDSSKKDSVIGNHSSLSVTDINETIEEGSQGAEMSRPSSPTSSRGNLANSYFAFSSSIPPHIKESSTTLETEQSVEENITITKRQGQWQAILIQLWIRVSQSYSKSHRFEEAYKAIQEADQLSVGLNADVWAQTGSIILEDGRKKVDDNDKQTRAIDAFKKALSIDPNHVGAHISLASIYIYLKEIELAEQLLERITKGAGWNQVEAWYLLGTVYRTQGNMEDAKNCLLFALQWSDITPIESFECLPRFV
ncbi:hypothetical protein BDB01DRAFT_593512 [Pilobolus umbonatus]|nr:hypothetical protein BDB01DRAFT_593512 [Pilobolus umbonatus]